MLSLSRCMCADVGQPFFKNDVRRPDQILPLHLKHSREKKSARLLVSECLNFWDWRGWFSRAYSPWRFSMLYSLWRFSRLYILWRFSRAYSLWRFSRMYSLWRRMLGSLLLATDKASQQGEDDILSRRNQRLSVQLPRPENWWSRSSAAVREHSWNSPPQRKVRDKRNDGLR